MAKRIPRTRLFAGKLLSAKQAQSLLIGPELAFVMLTGQGANLAQVQSLLGLFNLGSVLTATPKHGATHDLVSAAQIVVAAVKPDETENYRLPEVEHAVVSAALRRVHDLIRSSDLAVITRALEYVTRTFGGETRATVVPWVRTGPGEFVHAVKEANRD